MHQKFLPKAVTFTKVYFVPYKAEYNRLWTWIDKFLQLLRNPACRFLPHVRILYSHPLQLTLSIL
jgi:hypothetical protein